MLFAKFTHFYGLLKIWKILQICNFVNPPYTLNDRNINFDKSAFQGLDMHKSESEAVRIILFLIKQYMNINNILN